MTGSLDLHTPIPALVNVAERIIRTAAAFAAIIAILSTDGFCGRNATLNLLADQPGRQANPAVFLLHSVNPAALSVG